MTTSNKKIGSFIKKLRITKKLTQKEFAKLLNTTQSAIARMESGEQNFTTTTLNKISNVLNQKLINLGSNSMDFVIEGGHSLSGNITTNTSKNGAMGLMAASLLNKNTTILHGIPRIEEVNRIIEVLTSLHVSVKWINKHSLQIIPPKKITWEKINTLSAKKTRSIIMFMGPLMHLFSTFKLPHAQGCTLGKRTVSAHILGMEALGAKIKVTSNQYIVDARQLKPTTVVLYESGDTATENLIMLAAKIPGKTTLKFASSNYMVQDVCYFLQNLGIKIEGIGSTTLVIHGVKSINKPIEHYNTEDPIESMFLITAGIMTKSHIIIKRCPIDFLELELYKLKIMGLQYKRSPIYKAHNQQANLIDLEIWPSDLKALEMKLYARPYPGINIDNLPFFVAIASQAKGQTLIHDWVYENRAIYYMELAKLGVNMVLADPHRVYINGKSKLKPAQIATPPALRPSAIIMLTMMAAKGVSILRNVYSINRGYESIAERLNNMGAKIRILH